VGISAGKVSEGLIGSFALLWIRGVVSETTEESAQLGEFSLDWSGFLRGN
jgi:hypothetical protein